MFHVICQRQCVSNVILFSVTNRSSAKGYTLHYVRSITSLPHTFGIFISKHKISINTQFQYKIKTLQTIVYLPYGGNLFFRMCCLFIQIRNFSLSILNQLFCDAFCSRLISFCLSIVEFHLIRSDSHHNNVMDSMDFATEKP